MWQYVLWLRQRHRRLFICVINLHHPHHNFDFYSLVCICHRCRSFRNQPHSHAASTEMRQFHLSLAHTPSISRQLPNEREIFEKAKNWN